MNPYPVLILGAGPAGLALGVELQERGIPFLILERGGAPGESWRRMPTHLTLVSPWKSSWIGRTGRYDWPAHAAVSRQDYWQYLRKLAESHRLPIRTGTEVIAVERTKPEGFVVRTACGREFHARRLVNATGCFQNPFIPAIEGMSTTRIPQQHVAHYGDAARLSERFGQPSLAVLVLGKRLSAGQAMLELVDAGHRVWLSHRAPLQFGSGPLGWWIFFRIHPTLEAARLRWSGPKARGYDVRMPGGRARRLIEQGRVITVPSVQRFESDSVILDDGQRLAPDVVLYATGYRPVLKHLESLCLVGDSKTGLPTLSDMECVEVPGLYFLGLDGLRNFRSRFLRGIRQDAVALAERLSR